MIPSLVTAGADGALWISDGANIGRVTTNGVFTPVLTHISGNIGTITTGPDGKLWFTEPLNNDNPLTSSIGRISAIGGSAATINAMENTPFSGAVAQFVDGTPLAQANDFIVVINWGDGATSPGAIVGPQGGPFSVTGGHTYKVGSYQTTVILHDKVDNTHYTSAPGTVTVADAPLSPGTTVFPPGTCTEGTICQFTLGSFTDADPKAAVGLYTASIDWGDGTTSPTFVTACGKEFCVSSSHSFAEEGNYNAKVLVSDIGGSTLNLPGISISVTDAPITAYSATPASPHGVQFTEVIATFKDANAYAKAGDFTASIDWGDGTSSAGTVSADNMGFDVIGTHTYSDPGPHTAAVTINDIGGSTAQVSSVVADDYQIIATGRKWHVRLGRPFTWIVATCTDTDPASNISNLTAIIDWGDGTTPTTGTLIADGGGIYDVQGVHTYKKVFGKDVTVQINHVSGSAYAIVTDAVRLWPRTGP
jgi:hypothetical protein